MYSLSLASLRLRLICTQTTCNSYWQYKKASKMPKFM